MTSSWDDVLDSLERELVELETALAEDRVVDLAGGAWSPPEVMTRIPQHLIPRAVALLGRQDVVVARLHDAAAELHAELSYVTSVQDEARPASGPVFLDAAL